MMPPGLEIVGQVGPVFVILVLGRWLGRRGILQDASVAGLKTLTVNVGLPCLLFMAFLELRLEVTFVYVGLVVFGLCAALWFYGKLWHRYVQGHGPYFPFMMTGFEYGMLGVGLFATAFGVDRVSYIAVVDVGHEFFIWFVFLSLLLSRRHGRQSPGQLIRRFATTPVIIGIVLGLALNLLGVRGWMHEFFLARGLIRTLELLGQLTVPLILLIIGYGISLDRTGVKNALQVAALRLGVLIPAAYLIGRFVFRGWWGLDPMFQDALFTLVVLPPPFIVPLYMRPEDEANKLYANNILAAYTVISVLVFSAYIAVRAAIA